MCISTLFYFRAAVIRPIVDRIFLQEQTRQNNDQGELQPKVLVQSWKSASRPADGGWCWRGLQERWVAL